MRKARPHVLALVFAAIVMAVGSIALYRHATREHNILIASPSPPGAFEKKWLDLKPGGYACVSPITFPSVAGRVRLIPVTTADPVPPLRITVRAGDRVTTTVARDYESGKFSEVFAPIAIDRTTRGSVCARNIGDADVGLRVTTEPLYYTDSLTTFNGRPSDARISVQLYSAEPSTIAARIDDAVRQDAQLTGVLSRPLVWLLLFVVIATLVAGPLVAMTRSLRSDD